MRETYRYEALNRLSESLNATGVLSEEYKGYIISLALTAVSEAVRATKEEAKS